MKTLADLAALEAAAQIERTRCGTGTVVWHLWGNGPPVVLLHGGSGSWTHWARNIDALVDSGRQVLVPDLPGFGDSTNPPQGQDADVLPPWLEIGLHQLLGAESVDLVGFSFGGLTAGLMAARRQQPVQRLILVGAPALTDQPIGRIALRAWQAEPPGPARDAVHRYNLERLMLACPSAVDALALRIHDDNLHCGATGCASAGCRRQICCCVPCRTSPARWLVSGAPRMRCTEAGRMWSSMRSDRRRRLSHWCSSHMPGTGCSTRMPLHSMRHW